MSSTSETVKMNSLRIGSTVYVNWPNGRGKIQVIKGVVSSEPPRTQGAKVDIEFADGNYDMRIVNRNSKKPGIVSADASTLRSPKEMEKIANRGRKNSNGLELFVGEVVVVPNPENASQLYAVYIDYFEQGRCFQGIYCCDTSLGDRFYIDSIVRKLDDGEDPIKFLETVAAPNEEEEEEEEDVIEGPADNARDVHLAAQAQGNKIGEFWSGITYKVGKYNVRVKSALANDMYYVQEWQVKKHQFKGKQWKKGGRYIKKKVM